MRVLIPNPENIARAAEVLRVGDLVGMPTETVYGLAGDAQSDHAVTKIFAAKGRPQKNPLIIHLPDADAAMKYGEFNDAARAFASVFWPGPLTLVVPQSMTARHQISSAATAGLSTIALRVPMHPTAQELLRDFGGPIAAPSANRSGELSPTEVAHVAAAFVDQNQPKIILAGGRAAAGLESTIVACTHDAPRILRPGSITHEQLRAVMAEILPFQSTPADENAGPTAPGQMFQHYAPRTPMRLNARDVAADETLLAFGPELPWMRTAKFTLNLSPSGDLTEAAHNLFSHLHALDSHHARTIAVMPVPAEGLGLAIADRLMRAATPAG